MPVSLQPFDDAPAEPPGEVDRLAPLMAFIGAKGGVGSTLLCTNLAWSLAGQGLRVILLDLDLESGQTALLLCDQNSGPTVQDALSAIDRLDTTLLDTLLTPAAPGLQLLPAPRQAQMSAQDAHQTDGAALARLCRQARQLADVVLLDLPSRASSPACGPAVLSQAQHLALVTQPTLQATYSARRWLERLDDLEQDIEVVINGIHRHDALSPRQILESLGAQSHARRCRELPRSDALVAQALYEGQALSACDPRDPLARRITQWAQDVSAAWQASSPGSAQDAAALRHGPGPHPARRWLRAPFRRWAL